MLFGLQLLDTEQPALAHSPVVMACRHCYCCRIVQTQPTVSLCFLVER